MFGFLQNSKSTHSPGGPEASFTLFETVIALGIMATMMVELAGVQGNILYFQEYSANSSRAVWLAQRVMSQIEYSAIHRPFTEIGEVEEGPVPIEEAEGFTYQLSIKDWKLPLLDMLTGGGPKKDDGEDKAAEEPNPAAGALKSGLEQALGPDLLKVAKVSVSWPEGAKRNEINLSYLLTNQVKVDEMIAGLKSTFDSLDKSAPPQAGVPAATGKTDTKPTPLPGGGGSDQPEF